MAYLGLRAKSLVALVLACLLALIPAGLIGWLAVDAVREHFGLAYARNLTELNLQRILAPLSRELALSRRLADSEVTRRWLQNEHDPQTRELFFREAEGYRRDLSGHAYFIASARSGNYYFNGPDKPYSDMPRYTIVRDNPEDSWFFATLDAPAAYNINVNPDRQLKVTRVWINVVIRDGDQRVGLTGASLDLSSFLQAYTGSGSLGVTPIIVDANGAVQAHPDANLIEYNAVAQGGGEQAGIFRLLQQDGDRAQLKQTLAQAHAAPGSVHMASVVLQGTPQRVAVAYVPELNWYVMTAVDLRVARIFSTGWITPALLTLVLLLAALLLGFGFLVERLVLAPLRRLQQSAGAIAEGRYDVSLPAHRNDEIGDLSRAFGVMADQVRSHTAELESKVRERTRALEEANREMAVAHKKIGDSIDYASLIQRAILPDRQMTQSLGERHFVLWKPRDVVGGDFYVFRGDGQNCLIGVVDCAGHGVPGALMTMLARAAIDAAIGETGVRDPAAVLARTDAAVRAMLADAQLPRALATSIDAGLVYIDRAGARIVFAGAKIALYASDGESIRQYPGARRGLCERRPLQATAVEAPLLPGWTYYMSTDGFLDQAGGEHGFGFGNTRYADMLMQCARLPLSEQASACNAMLERYRGDNPQRDDITILAFRFD